MAARIGQLRLAGIGTGGQITSPTPVPAIGQQIAATGDVLSSLAASLTDSTTALGKLKSVEIEGKFGREIEAEAATLNPLDASYEDDINNLVETKRQAAAEQADLDIGSQEVLDDLQLRLKSQGEGVRAMAAMGRRKAIAVRGLALYGEASDDVLAEIRVDPDGADFYVAAFRETVKRLAAGIPPATLAKLALEFGDDAIFAQVEGLAEGRRFQEARALADDEASGFAPERFRTLKRRVKEIENQARRDDALDNEAGVTIRLINKCKIQSPGFAFDYSQMVHVSGMV